MPQAAVLSATAPDLAPKKTNGGDVYVSRTRSGSQFRRALRTGGPDRLLLEGQDAGDQAPMSNNCDPIRIMVVDDHPILRDGIAALIASQSDMRLVAEAATGREAIEQFRTLSPDITLMDLQMPEMSGIDALIAIRGEYPSAKVIVLTTYAGDALAARALKAGAQAYVLKGLVRKDLLEAIRAVHRGLKRIHPDVAAQLV